MMRGRRSYIHRGVDVRRTEGRRLHVIMDPSTPDSDSDLPFVRASTIWLIIPSPYSLIPIIWNKNSDDGDDIYIMVKCLFVCMFVTKNHHFHGFSR